VRADIDLFQSVDTADIDEKIEPISAPAPLIKNTGIHNDGGITNLYLNSEQYSAGEHFTADTGEDIETIVSGDNMAVSVGGQQIGTVASLGVKRRKVFKGYDDVMFTADSRIVTCQLQTDSVVVKVFTEDGVLIPASGRTRIFTQIGIIGDTYTSLNFIKWNGQNSSDSLKFVLRSGTKAIILDESALTAGEMDYRSNLFGSTDIAAALTIPGKYTVIINIHCRVSSVDINGKWKYWDGSGDGSGPFFNPPTSWALVGTFGINMVEGGSLGEILISYLAPDATYKLFSYDGTQWKFWDGTGSGTGAYYNGMLGYVIRKFSYTYDGGVHDALFIGGASGRISSIDYERNYKNYDGAGIGKAYAGAAAFVTTDTIAGLWVWDDFLIVSADHKIGSMDSTGAAKAYNAAGAGSGPYDNNAAIAVDVTWITTGPSGEMVVCGDAGRIGSYDGASWKLYSGAGAGSGIYNDGTAQDPYDISSAVVQNIDGTEMFLVLGNGTLSSWDGAHWRKYDGTGAGATGPYASPIRSTTSSDKIKKIVESPDGTKTLAFGSNQVLQINTDGTVKKSTIGINFNMLIQGIDVSPKNCIYEWNGKKYLVFGATQLSSYCFDTNLFKFWDGSGGGDGPYAGNTTTILGAGDNIYSIIQFQTYLVLVSSAGRVCSWDGTQWKYAGGGGAGAGPFSNTLNVLPGNFNSVCIYKTFLCIGGGTGRLQSYDGTAWKRYDGTSTGTGPYTNGGVVGAGSINAVCWYKTGILDYLICGSDGGNLGNWNGTAWRTFAGAGGSGPSTNQAAIGVQAFTCVLQYRKYLVVGGASGRIASWDPTAVAWKYYDGSQAGTGPYDNATVVGAYEINGLFEYDQTLIVKNNSRMGSIDKNNVVSIFSATNAYNQTLESNTGYSVAVVNNQLYISGIYGTFFYGPSANQYSFNFDDENNILSLPYNDRGQLFAYYFPDDDAYLFGVPGNTSNLFILYANDICYPISAKYAVPVEYPSGRTEIILTSDPIMFETKYRIKSRIGYIDDGATFKPVQQFPTYSLGRPLTYLQAECGPGYSQGNFQILDDTSVYSAFGPTDQDAEYSEVKTNTDSYIGNRGQIGSFFSIPINGFLGGLSYAAESDQVGVTLTALGEVDQTYIPQADDLKLLYLSSEGFVFVQLGSNMTQRIEKIGTNLYKINTISAHNIINVVEKILYLGSLDYNGRLLISDSATINAVIKRVVGIISARYSNSYDTGEKLAGVTTLTADKITAPGSKITGSGFIAEQYGINIFVDDDYFITIDETGAAETVQSLSGTIYVEDTREPMPMIVEYLDGVAVIAGKTFYLSGDDYDGAEGGNSIPGSFGYFNLFGQDYVYDNYYIYLLTIDELGLISSRTKTAPKIGLSFVAISPTAAFFFSAFDNGLYVFDGGRTVQKNDKLNRLGVVLEGIYSVHEGALYLETSDDFVIYRDGQKTVLPKSALMTGLNLYNTENGVMFGNNTTRWEYNYKAVGTVQPLEVQTAYLGEPGNNIVVGSIMVQLSSPSKAETTVYLTVQSYDETKDNIQTREITIKPNEWNDNGIKYIRIIPKYPRGSGVSIDILCNQKIIIVSVWYEYEIEAKTTAKGSK
jgi:hypothetical protein